MERSWFGTVRLMEIEIGVMVAIVLMALVVITARLARDPSEFAARWLAERARSAKLIAHDPAESAARAAAAAGSTAQDPEERATTAEWLDRLLGREPQQDARPLGNSPDQPDPESGRRVA